MNRKQLLLLSMLLVAGKIIGMQAPSEQVVTKICDYDTSHKKAVLDIAFEDVLKFFCGSHAVSLGVMSSEQFNEENKKTMDKVLSNPGANIRVLAVNERVAGFVEFNKAREQSIEKMLIMMKEQGLPACDEQQLAAALPQMKRTDAECKNYALIECLAVSKDFRGKGFGKALMKDALEKIKQRWPSLDCVRLTVNESNTTARKLYESLGFVPNSQQLAHLTLMKIAEYEKKL